MSDLKAASPEGLGTPLVVGAGIPPLPAVVVVVIVEVTVAVVAAPVDAVVVTAAEVVTTEDVLTG